MTDFTDYCKKCNERTKRYVDLADDFDSEKKKQFPWEKILIGLSVKSIHPSNDVLTYDFDQIGADTAISSHAQLPINIIMICVQCNNIPDDITA